MNTYIGQLAYDDNTIILGDALYGTCSTDANQSMKEIILNSFNTPFQGIQIRIRFDNGNTILSNVKLRIANLEFNVIGDCTCKAGEIISFTYEENPSPCWRINNASINSTIKSYVTEATSNVISSAQGLVYKGTIGALADHPTRYSLPTESENYAKGWIYRVISTGKYSGLDCIVGDFIIAIESAREGMTSIVPSHWAIIHNSYGDITPEGKLNQASALVVTDSNNKITTGASFSSTNQTEFLRADGVWATPSYTVNTDTHRIIQVNSTQFLGDNSTPLNILAGTNISFTTSNQGNLTINNDYIYTLPIASRLNLGGVKTIYHWDGNLQLNDEEEYSTDSNHSVSLIERTSVQGRYYAIERDNNGLLFVNIPWTNENNNYALNDHMHGNIQNDGTLAGQPPDSLNGKYLVIAGNQNIDNTNNIINNIISKSSIEFGNNEEEVLINKGTWKSIRILHPNEPGWYHLPSGAQEGDILAYNGTESEWESFSELIQELNLGSPMHFKGVAKNDLLADDIPYDPFVIIPNEDRISEQDKEAYKITYQGTDGDVVLDKQRLREYVWDGAAWKLLGYTTDTEFDSDAVVPSDSSTLTTKKFTWIDNITQTTTGHIQVSRQHLDILPIANGGTGRNSFESNRVILSQQNQNESFFDSREYLDSIGANALSSNSNRFITERSVYYGLPTINELHNYTSNSQIYAPISPGLSNQILISGTRIDNNNNSIYDPIWAESATIEKINATGNNEAATILTLGESNGTRQVQGKIILQSVKTSTPSATSTHTILGVAPDTDVNATNSYTHFLPNANGYFLQLPDANGVGSSTQPIFIGPNSTVQAITYIPNRLYYGIRPNPYIDGQRSDSFDASENYIDNDKLGINITSWPQNNTDKLYVNGNTTIYGNLIVNETSQLRTNVGIGTAPHDSTTQGQNYILKIDGSISITNESYDAYIEIITNNNQEYFSFYPNSGNSILGTTNSRWTALYLSDRLEIDNSIIMSTNTIELSTVNINFDNKWIIEHTEDNNTTNEKFSIQANYGEGAQQSTIKLVGNQNGFAINPKLFIGSDAINSAYVLNITGDTYTTGSIKFNDDQGIIWVGTDYQSTIKQNSSDEYLIINISKISSNSSSSSDSNTTSSDSSNLNTAPGILALSYDNEEKAYFSKNVSSDENGDNGLCFYPAEEKGGSLGLSNHRWRYLYIGEADSYGDEYTPIWWYNGSPAIAVSQQRIPFTFNQYSQGNDTTLLAVNLSLTFRHNAIKEVTMINEIVVEDGMQYLNSPIHWEIIHPNGQRPLLILTVNAKGLIGSQVISGYILISNTDAINPEQVIINDDQTLDNP